MNNEFYQNLTDQSIKGSDVSLEVCRQILLSPEIDLFPLLNAAYTVRKHYCGNEVSIHIINNAQNGFCPEDCHYCPQAKSSQADIEEYPLKSEAEILAEAKNAYEKGAFRYCMVFAGRGPSLKRTEHLAGLIRKIKSLYPIQICVSAGLLDPEKAKLLKEAGLDRLNHNLNTSRRHYPNICTTHTYQDRLQTLQAARDADIELCSGLIVGMGETAEDIIEVGQTLRQLKSPSIPVNYLVPIEGNKLSQTTGLTPQYCLRVLCLFRFLNPKAEIRVAAGRELHLRELEVLAFYPANSLFLDGYLNTKGASRTRVYQMLKDAGFAIKSDQNLEKLLELEKSAQAGSSRNSSSFLDRSLLKNVSELRPFIRT